MKVWLAAILLGVLVAGAMVYAALGFARGPEPAGPVVPGGEHVQGTKREPGTFRDPSITVAAGQEALGQPDVTIDVNVMRPVFAPSEIRVKQGQVVRLRLHGMDSGLADMPELQGAVGLNEFSGHGFQVLGPYDIWVTGIRKGVTKEVTFKASEAGEFAFECTVFCSPYHYMMQGKLVVEAR